MGIFDNVNQILGKAMGGDASEADVHAAYDQVAQSAPPTTLADALSHAFKSDQTPAFPSMIAISSVSRTPSRRRDCSTRSWPR